MASHQRHLCTPYRIVAPGERLLKKKAVLKVGERVSGQSGSRQMIEETCTECARRFTHEGARQRLGSRSLLL